MTIFETARFSLPLLAAGQAHKELFHNDALILLDFLVHPVVEAIANDPQSLSPVAGQCWVVGLAAVGDWSGRENQIAGWSAGGWNFIKPQESMKITVSETNQLALYREGGWWLNADITTPTGGNNIDSEARSAIDSILAALKVTGILPEIGQNDSSLS